MGPSTPPRPAPARRGARLAGSLLVGAIVLAGCGSGEGDPDPAAAPAVDPTVATYCDTVTRVQAEQTAPQAGQGGVPAASEAARRQVADLVATAPPEIAEQWRTVAQLTEQALSSLAATGGDPNLIDREALVRLESESRPAVERIAQVTEERCGISFRPPA